MTRDGYIIRTSKNQEGRDAAPKPDSLKTYGQSAVSDLSAIRMQHPVSVIGLHEVQIFRVSLLSRIQVS